MGTTIGGFVKNEEGKPVAGAKIWLTRANFPQEAKTLEVAAADAAGRFTLRAPSRVSGPNRWLMLAARDGKGRLGGANLPPAGDPAGQAIRIELFEVHDYHGKLADAAGQPIA